VGRQAEFDVDEQRARGRRLQHLQQTRVVSPRPWPFVQGLETVGIDADDDDVAVAFVPQHGCTRLRSGVLDTREAAGRMQKVRAREDGQHAGWPDELPKTDHLKLGQVVEEGATGDRYRHAQSRVDVELEVDDRLVGANVDVQSEIEGAASGIERDIDRAGIEGQIHAGLQDGVELESRLGIESTAEVETRLDAKIHAGIDADVDRRLAAEIKTRVVDAKLHSGIGGDVDRRLSA